MLKSIRNSIRRGSKAKPVDENSSENDADRKPAPTPEKGDRGLSWKIESQSVNQHAVPSPEKVTDEQVADIKNKLGSDWVDFDKVCFCIAQSVGYLSDTAEFEDSKWIFWTENPIRDAIMLIATSLVQTKELEERTAPDYQFKVC